MPDEINLNTPQEKPTEKSETHNLTKNQLSFDPQSNMASSSGKDGVTLPAIKPRRNKTVSKESFTDYMKKKFGITNIEELSSSRSVTRSGTEYKRNPAKVKMNPNNFYGTFPLAGRKRKIAK
ncbi:hypothetical protein AVEN_236606-1 [Araneus ventricosus]|uniref:Uncharacterized protein n=1 Tax=Araneus ventricosus TaxID=182803 RepID=A0A4Y2Q2V5_ARAVE|nr:hypothetical protein AVEN_236606-1 [Araneus ventricosus]